MGDRNAEIQRCGGTIGWSESYADETMLLWLVDIVRRNCEVKYSGVVVVMFVRSIDAGSRRCNLAGYRGSWLSVSCAERPLRQQKTRREQPCLSPVIN